MYTSIYFASLWLTIPTLLLLSWIFYFFPLSDDMHTATEWFTISAPTYLLRWFSWGSRRNLRNFSDWCGFFCCWQKISLDCMYHAKDPSKNCRRSARGLIIRSYQFKACELHYYCCCRRRACLTRNSAWQKGHFFPTITNGQPPSPPSPRTATTAACGPLARREQSFSSPRPPNIFIFQ